MKKKKILAAVLAACMAASLAACAGKEKTPSVEELLKNKQELKYSTTEGDFEYNVYDGYATITGYIGKSKHITVPSTINNIPILVIGSHTFTDNYDVKTITISDGIMVISDATRSGWGFASPFARCGSLENIELPDSLKYIGSCAFYACHALTKIDIPEEVETIGSEAFWGCTSLKEVKVLNPNMSFQYNISISESPILYGFKNSTTEKFCKEHGNAFKLIEE